MKVISTINYKKCPPILNVFCDLCVTRMVSFRLKRILVYHYVFAHLVRFYSGYCPQTKLREGNVFTGVCDSVHRGVCLLPGACLLPEGGSGPRRGCLLWGGGAWSQGGWGQVVWSRGVPGVETPPTTATAAGGTHPTGMHSCFQ